MKSKHHMIILWCTIGFISKYFRTAGSYFLADLWVNRALISDKTSLLTRSGEKFLGGRVKLNGSDYLITLQIGVTLKVHPLKGSLSMDLILDEDYKGNVTGEMARLSFETIEIDNYTVLESYQ